MKNNTQYLQSIWDQVLTSIHDSNRLDDSIFDNFYGDAKLYNLSETKAIVSVPTFIHKTIMIHEKELIETSLEAIIKSNNPIHCDLLLESELKDIDNVEKTAQNQVLIQPEEEIQFKGTPINPDHTFDNFIVGTSNRESHSAALACSYNPGKFFNPLFIYGNSGLGKTHLMHAIANYILKNDPTKKVYYTDSNRFVEQVVSSIRKNKIEAFKRFMYSTDVLLVDDIQFLAGKEKSHEIFFTIFNELVNNRKQIVLVSDRIPTEIKGLEDRLISRFSSGLSVGVDSPEFETSLAILKMKLKNSSIDVKGIDEESLAFIASNFNRDVRQLEGALNRVLFYAIEFSPCGNKIDLETTSHALKGQVVVPKNMEGGVTVKKIIDTVADYYGLTKHQILSKSRTKNISNARHIAIYLARIMLDLPYKKIGQEFGGRDHSTIINSCEKVEKMKKANSAYIQAVQEIEKIVKS